MFDCMRLFKLKLDKPIQCLCKKLILQTKIMKHIRNIATEEMILYTFFFYKKLVYKKRVLDW